MTDWQKVFDMKKLLIIVFPELYYKESDGLKPEGLKHLEKNIEGRIEDGFETHVILHSDGNLLFDFLGEHNVHRIKSLARDIGPAFYDHEIYKVLREIGVADADVCAYGGFHSTDCVDKIAIEGARLAAEKGRANTLIDPCVTNLAAKIPTNDVDDLSGDGWFNHILESKFEFIHTREGIKEYSIPVFSHINRNFQGIYTPERIDTLVDFMLQSEVARTL